MGRFLNSLGMRRRKVGAIPSKGDPEKHLSCPTDISKGEEVENLISQVIQKYGRVDILVNNAAVSYVGRVKDMNLERAFLELQIHPFLWFVQQSLHSKSRK